MEHGSGSDESGSTFSFTDEDHTLANSLRFSLNQDGQDLPIFCSPRVAFCGYSIPHPSQPRVNIRLQTTGDPANEILKDSCQDLLLICQHARKTFEQVAQDFKNEQALEAMTMEQ